MGATPRRALVRASAIGVLALTMAAAMNEVPQPTGATADDSRRRASMVERQIVARGVSDPGVLRAMRVVPRHRFVPATLADYAYDDSPLTIGHGQTISQPYIVAYMTELLQVRRDQRVLEIGTGSGYQAAVLAEVAGEVYTIEIVKALADRARDTLTALGYSRVHVRHGDGYAGWPEHAPFDRILLTAAPESIPQPLLDQLAEGGRLVAPVGSWAQDIVIATKRQGKIHTERTIAVRFVPFTRTVRE